MLNVDYEVNVFDVLEVIVVKVSRLCSVCVVAFPYLSCWAVPSINYLRDKIFIFYFIFTCELQEFNGATTVA